jgi:hypothetical protein
MSTMHNGNQDGAHPHHAQTSMPVRARALLPPTRGADSPNLKSTAGTLPLFRRTGAKLFLL